MQTDIILAGVGGQGILSIATIIGAAAIEQGLFIKQAEVHGMSQRGGDVQSNLRIASTPIASDLIPKGKAHLIIALEPMEALRYLPYLGKDGWVITNSMPYVNIDNYPDAEEIATQIRSMKHSIMIDVDSMAKKVASARAANIVLLGAASPFIGMETDKIEDGIRRVFAKKGEAIVEMNLKAFQAGMDYAHETIKLTQP